MAGHFALVTCLSQCGANEHLPTTFVELSLVDGILHRATGLPERGMEKTMLVIHPRRLYHSIRISVMGLWEKLGLEFNFVGLEGAFCWKPLYVGDVIWMLMRILACEG